MELPPWRSPSFPSHRANDPSLPISIFLGYFRQTDHFPFSKRNWLTSMMTIWCGIMKSAVLALDPRAGDDPFLDVLVEQVAAFQARGFFERLEIISVMHRSLYPIPAEVYRTIRGGIRNRAKEAIIRKAQGRLKFDGIFMVESEATTGAPLIDLLSRAAAQKRADVLILGSDSKSRSENQDSWRVTLDVVRSSKVPTFILKGEQRGTYPFQFLNVLIPFKGSHGISDSQLRPLAEIASSFQSHVVVLLVSPRRRPILNFWTGKMSDESDERTANRVAAELTRLGVPTRVGILELNDTIGEVLAKYERTDRIGMCLYLAPSGRLWSLRKNDEFADLTQKIGQEREGSCFVIAGDIMDVEERCRKWA